MLTEEDHIQRAYDKIESYILPPKNDSTKSSGVLGALHPSVYHSSRSKRKDTSSSPTSRLENVLYELALGDQIRSLQTMYRDGYDEQCLGEDLRNCLKLRQKNPQFSSFMEIPEKIAMKDLLSKIAEGRARSVTLLRLSHTDQSLAFIRGLADLANTYALQSMWAQAEEKILLAWAKMITYEERLQQHRSSWNEQVAEAATAARRLQIIYTTLRRHVINNYGQVKRSLVQELTIVLGENLGETTRSSASTQFALNSTTQFLSTLLEFFTTSKSKVPLKQLTASYFQDRQPYKPVETAKEEVKTWGDVVHFLRHSSEAVQHWMAAIDAVLLPQNKAILQVPFTICDRDDRRLAHPQQLVQIFPEYPNAMKLVAGSTFLRALDKLPIEVPLFINANTGSVQQLGTVEVPATSAAVSYELPITWEEYVSLYVMENALQTTEYPLQLLKMQILTIKGLCAVHLHGQLDSAEDTFKKAIQELETAGCEMELVACELYNAIAQMMICKFQHWQSTRKQRYRRDAEEWLISGGSEAQKAMKAQIKLVKKQYDYRSHPISTAELEYEARVQVIKRRIRELYDLHEEDSDEVQASLQAAYRYLLKTVEIWETVQTQHSHHARHPSSLLTLATACLAVASVCHMSKQHEDTRAWLGKALRHFEKQTPKAVQALAFTQTQLAQTLEALGCEDESKAVLLAAYRHYIDEARRLLEARANSAQQLLHMTSPILQQAPTLAKHTSKNGGRVVAFDPSLTANHYKPIPPEEAHHPPVRSNHYDPLLPNKGLHHVGLLPVILRHSQLEAVLTAASQATQQLVAFCRRSQRQTSHYEVSLYLEDLAQLLEAAYGWDSLEAAEAYRQAGQRCIQANDLGRGLRHLTTALQSYQTLCTASSGGSSSTGGVAHNGLGGAAIIGGNEALKTLHSLQKLVDRVKEQRRESLHNNNGNHSDHHGDPSTGAGAGGSDEVWVHLPSESPNHQGHQANAPSGPRNYLISPRGTTISLHNQHSSKNTAHQNNHFFTTPNHQRDTHVDTTQQVHTPLPPPQNLNTEALLQEAAQLAAEAAQHSLEEDILLIHREELRAREQEMHLDEIQAQLVQQQYLVHAKMEAVKYKGYHSGEEEDEEDNDEDGGVDRPPGMSRQVSTRSRNPMQLHAPSNESQLVQESSWQPPPLQLHEATKNDRGDETDSVQGGIQRTPSEEALDLHLPVPGVHHVQQIDSPILRTTLLAVAVPTTATADASSAHHNDTISNTRGTSDTGGNANKNDEHQSPHRLENTAEKKEVPVQDAALLQATGDGPGSPASPASRSHHSSASKRKKGSSSPATHGARGAGEEAEDLYEDEDFDNYGDDDFED